MAGRGTREQIMVALFDRLKAAYPFTVAGRRNVAPESVVKPGETGLFLLKQHENMSNAGDQPSLSKRTMNVLALCYFDASNDENLVPDTTINAMTDAIDADLRRIDNFMTQKLTLGGLCESVIISGQIDNAPGDQTGKGLAIIPIEIVIP